MTDWREEDGYVTVAVVGITALIAVLVAGVLTMSRPTSLLARLDIEQLRRQARIEAGVSAAAFLLFFANETPPAMKGRQVAIDGEIVSVAVSAEKGRVDLNKSSPDLLKRVFAAAKGTSMTPDAFAARVADWRDEDNEKTIEGAEAFEYTAVPSGVRPANGPFRSVADLRFLLGLSGEDRARIEPFLTTYNRDGTVDPKNAVEPVRSALKGDRLSAGPETESVLAEAMEPGGAQGAASEESPEAFRVRVLTQANRGGLVHGAEAIIAPPVDEGENYSILEWQDVLLPASAGASQEGEP